MMYNCKGSITGNIILYYTSMFIHQLITVVTNALARVQTDCGSYVADETEHISRLSANFLVWLYNICIIRFMQLCNLCIS